MFPALWTAPSPPTAAMEPDAALETLNRDVIVPRDGESGPINRFDTSMEGEAEVKNPARFNEIDSRSVRSLLGTFTIVGLASRTRQSLSITGMLVKE